MQRIPIAKPPYHEEGCVPLGHMRVEIGAGACARPRISFGPDNKLKIAEISPNLYPILSIGPVWTPCFFQVGSGGPRAVLNLLSFLIYVF